MHRSAVAPSALGASAVQSANDIDIIEDGFEGDAPAEVQPLSHPSYVSPRAKSKGYCKPLSVLFILGLVVAIIAGALLFDGKDTNRERTGLTGLRDDHLQLAVANDLWAIHDLILAGYGAIFMQKDSVGQKEVQEAAMQLARLLPALHPHPACRERIAHMLKTTPGEPASEVKGLDQLLLLAEVTWKCLPAHFFSKSFDRPFKHYEVSGFHAAQNAKMTRVRNPRALGVCRSTNWPRTCSYWVSMHALAYKADELRLGQPLIRSLLNIIAGGATLCGGCTKHFRLLTGPFLSESVKSDFGDVF